MDNKAVVSDLLATLRSTGLPDGYTEHAQELGLGFCGAKQTLAVVAGVGFDFPGMAAMGLRTPDCSPASLLGIYPHDTSCNVCKRQHRCGISSCRWAPRTHAPLPLKSTERLLFLAVGSYLGWFYYDGQSCYIKKYDYRSF
jgi:hypothetical protein